MKSITLPKSITKIEDFAFQDCESLNISIPDTVKYIGEGAFKGCKGIADQNGFVIVSDVLYHYSGRETDVVIPDGVTCISYEAFENCETLVSITIPDTVDSICDSAFYGCNALTGIAIAGNPTDISNCFSHCENLRKVVISGNDVRFGEYTFDNTEDLTLYAPAGSATERCAEKYNISFVAI